MSAFEGWSQRAWNWTDSFDHTYVSCPADGGFFDCWADNHVGPDQRHIVSGNGNYAWANCYRGSIGPWPDTAFMGVYGIDGTCHQSANCFLYSAGVTLDNHVRGYWLTQWLWGTYGKAFYRWLAIYWWCYWSNMGFRADVMEANEAPEEPEDSLPYKIRALHAAQLAKRRPPHPNEIMIEETALVTRHFIPGFNDKKIKDLQFEFLQEKDVITHSGIKGEPLVHKLNEMGNRAQKALARRLHGDEYETLMGVEPGHVLNIIDVSLADAAGRPVPMPPGV